MQAVLRKVNRGERVNILLTRCNGDEAAFYLREMKASTLAKEYQIQIVHIQHSGSDMLTETEFRPDKPARTVIVALMSVSEVNDVLHQFAKSRTLLNKGLWFVEDTGPVPVKIPTQAGLNSQIFVIRPSLNDPLHLQISEEYFILRNSFTSNLIGHFNINYSELSWNLPPFFDRRSDLKGSKIVARYYTWEPDIMDPGNPDIGLPTSTGGTVGGLSISIVKVNGDFCPI